MKINGLKYLNSNFYDSIMMRDRGLELKVDVKSNEDITTVKKSPSFYDSIKDLDDKKKVTEIVRYFLRNNSVNSLSDKFYLERYKGHFLRVGGTRDLFLQLSSDNVEKGLINEIINKYVVDRYKFLIDNQDVKNIEIYYGENSPSYKRYVDDFNYNSENIISIRLMSREHILSSFEEEFIDRFIKEKIDNADGCIKAYANGLFCYNSRKLNFGEDSGYYFSSKDFTLKIDKYFYYHFYKYVEEHNKRFEDSKKLQLTFDDFHS